jgi:hypothetical protein
VGGLSDASGDAAGRGTSRAWLTLTGEATGARSAPGTGVGNCEVGTSWLLTDDLADGPGCGAPACGPLIGIGASSKILCVGATGLCDGMRAPQPPQNRESGAFSVPQVAQRIPPQA